MNDVLLISVSCRLLYYLIFCDFFISTLHLAFLRKKKLVLRFLRIKFFSFKRKNQMFYKFSWNIFFRVFWSKNILSPLLNFFKYLLITFFLPSILVTGITNKFKVMLCSKKRNKKNKKHMHYEGNRLNLMCV